MFPENKEPDRLYFTIKEVAGFLEINISTLRYWESEFKGLKPRKNNKGDRFYNHEMIALVRYIYFLLKEKGYTIEGAKKVLRHADSRQNTIYKQIERLENIKVFLIDLKKNL